MDAINAWFYKQLAVGATLFKRPERALEYWERIRALRPRDPSVIASIGHMHAAAGRRDPAIELASVDRARQARGRARRRPLRGRCAARSCRT